MSASSRRKGLKGEQEVARILRQSGSAVRGLESKGDWLVMYTDRQEWHVEVKRQERVRLPEWLRQARDEAPAGCVPVVAFRQLRDEWYACLPLSDLVSAVS
jgi:hypothetical protein